MNQATRIVLVILAVAATLAIHVKTKKLAAPGSPANWSAGNAAEEEAASPLLGETAPAFTLNTLDGTPLDLATLRGETIVLNFFTTWCGPCRMEMPDLARFASTAGPRGIRVVGVDVREPLEQVKPFAEDLGLAFPVALDEEGAASEAFGVEAYPTTVLIAPSGEVLAVHVGMIRDFAEWYQEATASSRTRWELPAEGPVTDSAAESEHRVPAARPERARGTRGSDHT